MISEKMSRKQIEEESKEKAQAKQEAFLQKDYELKISYLTNQFTRMWNRFNYFVAIETGLVGGKFLIPNGKASDELPIAGLLISAVWHVMGAEDGYLVRLYRHQVEKSAEELVKAVLPTNATQ